MPSALTRKLLTLKKHEGFQRYAANTSWMFAEQLLRIIAGLFVGIWVARYLGPEKFGLFSYVVAFTSIFGGIAKLGLDGVMVRELVNKPELKDVYLGTAFWLKIVAALLVLLLIAITLPFTSNDSTTNIFIFIIASGFIFQSFEVIEFYFQSQVLAKIVSLCKVIQLFLSSLIKLFLVIKQADLIWFVVVTTFDLMSLAASYLISYVLNSRTQFFRFFDRKVAISLLRSSWPLMFSMVLILLYMKIDQVMIKEMLGSQQVGLYSSVIKILELVFLFPNILSNSLFPALVRARSSSMSMYELRLKRFLAFLLYSSILGVAIIFFIGGGVIELLYGLEYTDADPIFLVLVCSTPFVFWSVASARWYVAEGLERLLMFRALLAMLINISLNLLLIPKWGVYGAAVSTVTTYFFIALVFDLISEKSRRLFNIKMGAIPVWKIL